MLIAIFWAGCIQETHVVVHGDQPITYTVEIADTRVKQAKGLMFRNRLGEREGMLFVYKEATVKHFWMKYTPLPLDIIFISEEKRIVNVEAAVPCRSAPCPRYASRGPVRYVLEINRGQSDKYGFKQGTIVDFVDSSK